jgi:hypothetical protein
LYSTVNIILFYYQYSTGFALNHDAGEGEVSNKVDRGVKCGTEKGRQKAKNMRTAGLLVIECLFIFSIHVLFSLLYYYIKDAKYLRLLVCTIEVLRSKSI